MIKKQVAIVLILIVIFAACTGLKYGIKNQGPADLSGHNCLYDDAVPERYNLQL